MANPDLQIRKGMGGGGTVSKNFPALRASIWSKIRGLSPGFTTAIFLVNMCELRYNILHFTVKYVPCFFLLLVNLVKNRDEPSINQKHYH